MGILAGCDIGSKTMPTVKVSDASPTTEQPSPTLVPTVLSTATPTPRPTLSSTATPTATATHSPVPVDTPEALDAITFVNNADCGETISRELLPTMELVLRVDGEDVPLIVEVADDGNERQQGLMCRETVPDGTGMLFVFEAAYDLRFWMFNTYVALDIVYFDGNGDFLNLLRMEPCPRPVGFSDGDWSSHCSIASSGYGSAGVAQYALELPSGWLESAGLRADEIEGITIDW